jgi:polysaccharide export outer membrane protein
MRERHDTLATGDDRLRTGCRGVWIVFVMFLAMALSVRYAEAQFSGPALGIDTPVNPPVTITTDPAILYPANRDVYLWRDDLIAIHLYQSPDYGPVVRIGLDGSVQLPLIGTVQVEGLTVHQAQDLIAR